MSKKKKNEYGPQYSAECLSNRFTERFSDEYLSKFKNSDPELKEFAEIDVRIFREAYRLLDEGQKFYCEDIAVLEGKSLIDAELSGFNLPFPVTVLEFNCPIEEVKLNEDATDMADGIQKSANGNVYVTYPAILLMCEDSEIFYELFGIFRYETDIIPKLWYVLFEKIDGDMWIPFPAVVCVYEKDGKYDAAVFKMFELPNYHPGRTATSRELYKWFSLKSKLVMTGFVALAMCQNLQREVVYKPNPNSVTAQTRKRKGLKPHYSYWALFLDLRNRKKVEYASDCVSSKRASPRTHLRRGHIRHLEGRNTFIRSSVIGGDGDGNIDKLYVI